MPVVGLGVSIRKGGRAAIANRLSELMDELAEGIVAVAETGGSLLLGLPLDEDSTESLVLALLWGAGFLEKA